MENNEKQGKKVEIQSALGSFIFYELAKNAISFVIGLIAKYCWQWWRKNKNEK